jgi:hypothetical protein
MVFINAHPQVYVNRVISLEIFKTKLRPHNQYFTKWQSYLIYNIVRHFWFVLGKQTMSKRYKYNEEENAPHVQECFEYVK